MARDDVRGNSPPDRDEVIANVRRMLNWKSFVMPQPSPAEALPLDPLADLDATRAVLRMLYG